MVFSGIFAGGIAAIQLLPTAEYVLSSSNIDRIYYQSSHLDFAYFSLNFFPDLLGNYSYLNAWFVKGKEVPEIGIGYVGVTMLVFAVVSALEPKVRKKVGIFWVLGIISLLIAYSVPGLDFIVDRIPILTSSTLHRMEAYWGFSIIVAGVFGFDAIFIKRTVSGARLTLCMLAFGVLATIIFLSAVEQFSESTDYSYIYGRYVWWVWGLFIANLLAISVALAFRKSILALIMMVAIVLVETYGHSYNYLDRDHPSQVNDTPGAIVDLKQIIDGRRILLLDHDLMPANLGAYYGISQIRVYNPIKPRHSVIIERDQSKADVSSLELLRRVAVRYYVLNNTNTDISAINRVMSYFALSGSKDKVAFREVAVEEEYTVVEDLLSWPRAYIVTDKGFIRGENDFTIRSDAQIREVDFIVSEAGNVNVVGECYDTCLFVLNDTYYPGWQVTVGSAYATVERVVHSLDDRVSIRGVVVPRGKFDIEMKYQPMSFLFGVVGSLLSLVIFFLVCLINSTRLNK